MLARDALRSTLRRILCAVALALFAAHAPAAAAPAKARTTGSPAPHASAAPASRAAAASPAPSSDMGTTADSIEAWRPPRDSSLVTFLIVRHAEKNTMMLGHDVPLTERGVARARELRRIAGETGVDAVYATPTQRAMQTGEPLAAALGESLTVVYHTGETVRRLKTRHWGQVVVVVGHSDTVPAIVEGLTGKRVPGFQSEFDLLYVVTLSRDGRSSILRLRYGEKS